jgi:CheY-like chemotaxis protein
MAIVMPIMSGTDAAREIRAIEKQCGHSAVPIVAISGGFDHHTSINFIVDHYDVAYLCEYS